MLRPCILSHESVCFTEGVDGNQSLIAGVAFSVLLALFTLILVVCIIRRYFNESVCLSQLVFVTEYSLNKHIYSNTVLKYILEVLVL